ncbi:probable serine/threonine-protein kinase yakA isoform X2 [Drosophila busckii]|uniref:probable serine/threonine-protein kinase yakA isoform X2 n=1 Tax=Drosophila busckii TaxID=30019 RepID=UPI00083EF6CD|nr:probable serine/threonine-protein kinase yakA isoform X2 [Drosophila busckii]
MVLTNFECWAHGEADAPNFETGPRPRHSNVDPFNARVVASSSNGYYGYAIVNNAAAAASDNNNNNNMQDMQMHENAATDSSNAAARCNKKRCFVMGLDEQLDMEMMDNLTTVKRCRYDDGDLVAQYCNDFFSLPATQVIGTQSCLMESDYDMQAEQPPQQQQQQHQEQQQQQQQQHPRIQQHYQGHLQRVSRCMMSHMI